MHPEVKEEWEYGLAQQNKDGNKLIFPFYVRHVLVKIHM
jgi:hypothetical protein